MNSEAREVEKAIVDAFAGVPTPPRDAITPHRCEECDGVRDALARVDPEAVRDDVVEHHSDALPILGPAALRRFLPAYLRYALRHPESLVFELALYHLGASGASLDEPYWSERIHVFSARERAAIVRYVDWVERLPGAEHFVHEVARARKLWSAEAASAG